MSQPSHLEQPHPRSFDQDGISELRKQEIGDILQQIMNITDQSLDEAQARLVFCAVNAYSCFIRWKLFFTSSLRDLKVC